MSLSLLLRRSGVTTMMTPRMIMHAVAPSKAYFHNTPAPAKNAMTAAASIKNTDALYGAVVSLDLAKDQHFDL